MNENLINLLGYLATTFSCSGNLLIVFKLRAGFVVWTIGNIVWIFIDVKIGLFSQIWMMVMYAALNIWGWIEWSRKQ